MRVKVATWGLIVVAIVGVVAAVFYCEPWIKGVAYGGMLAPRHGRVIDAESGAGIADVIVVRKWFTGARCEAEKAALTDAGGFYDLPGAAADVAFPRTWLHQLTLYVVSLPLNAPGSFHAGILLYKAGYAPDLRPENWVPDDPRVDIPPVRVRQEPADSDTLIRYDRALQANLACQFHGANALPVQRHLHIVGQPWTDADNDPPPVLSCEGERVASAFDCTYKGHPELVKRAAQELTAFNLAHREIEPAARIR